MAKSGVVDARVDLDDCIARTHRRVMELRWLRQSESKDCQSNDVHRTLIKRRVIGGWLKDEEAVVPALGNWNVIEN